MNDFFNASNILQIVVTIAIAIIGGFLKNLMKDINGLGAKLGKLTEKQSETNVLIARLETALKYLEKK